MLVGASTKSKHISVMNCRLRHYHRAAVGEEAEERRRVRGRFMVRVIPRATAGLKTQERVVP